MPILAPIRGLSRNISHSDYTRFSRTSNLHDSKTRFFEVLEENCSICFAASGCASAYVSPLHSLYRNSAKFHASKRPQ